MNTNEEKKLVEPITDTKLRTMLPLIFDNTMLAAYCKCPRYLYWFLRRLDLREPPPYFAWGKAFGAGLNRWHALQGKMEYTERFAEMYLAAEKEWLKDSPIEKGDNTWENLEKLLKAYTLYYGEEENWTMPYGRGELGFKIPLPVKINSYEVYYAGSMDAPILWEGYGMTIREDKTTSGYVNTQGIDPEVTQYDDSSQVTGYILGHTMLHGEVPVGVLMNIVSKKKRKDINEQFARYLVTTSEWDLQRFTRDTLRIIEDIHHEWERWDWPLLGRRDPINCVGGKGRSECIYRRMCHAEAEPWELEDYYNFQESYVWREPWQPWEREGENE